MNKLFGLFLLAAIVGASAPAFTQGGMGPGPGMAHSTGGGGVAFDAASSNSRSGGAGSLTWTHTPVGTPTGVAVGLTNFQPNCTVSGVTYGGAAMTQAQGVTIGATPTDNAVQLYGLANPSSGAQTVSINFSSGTNCFVAGASITVTGGNTTTVFRASNNATGNSSAPAVSVTSAVGDLVVDIAATADNNVTTTGVGGSQTARVSNVAGGGNRMSMSTSPGSASSTNMSWTIASSNRWANLAASFQP